MKGSFFLIIETCLERRELWVVVLLDSHAFHFDKPACSAYRCVNDDARLVGETLIVKLFDGGIVGNVAHVDNHDAYIIVATVGFVEQRLYVSPHAVGLLDDIFGMLNLPLVVDAGRT